MEIRDIQVMLDEHVPLECGFDIGLVVAGRTRVRFFSGVNSEMAFQIKSSSEGL